MRIIGACNLGICMITRGPGNPCDICISNQIIYVQTTALDLLNQGRMKIISNMVINALVYCYAYHVL